MQYDHIFMVPYKVCCGSKSKSSKETEKPTKERECDSDEQGECCNRKYEYQWLINKTIKLLIASLIMLLRTQGLSK